jgi:AmpD protein
VPAGPDGLIPGARFRASPHCDERPPGAATSLLVLHSISMPPGEFGGDGVERLFTGTLDPHAHPAFAAVAGLRVSAHFFVRRDGEIVQFVPLAGRAWHAGASSWRGRSACNDFSVGIEIEGVEGAMFDSRQYRALAPLVHALRRVLPISAVAAHSDIAPGRKGDPGAGFSWTRFHEDLLAF